MCKTRNTPTAIGKNIAEHKNVMNQVIVSKILVRKNSMMSVKHMVEPFALALCLMILNSPIAAL